MSDSQINKAVGIYNSLNEVERAEFRQRVGIGNAASDTTEDDTAIARASFRGAYENGIEEAKRRMRQYKAERDELQEAITSFVQWVNQSYEVWQNETNKLYAPLKDIFDQKGQPQFAAILSEIRGIISGIAIELHNTIETRHPDAFPPRVSLLRAGYKLEIVTSNAYGFYLIAYALAYSDYSPVLCGEVCRQLRTKAEIGAIWASKLAKWLKTQESREDIGQDVIPSRADKIKERLELHARFMFKETGMSQEQFAHKWGCTTQDLRRAARLYEIVETESRNTPPEITDFLNKIERTMKSYSGTLPPDWLNGIIDTMGNS